ncbi:Hypothetical protein A7982_04716 [Minicystis rosea]|nr:Hypothetical protein A7982_04716 [Minicystis rosea]
MIVSWRHLVAVAALAMTFAACRKSPAPTPSDEPAKPAASAGAEPLKPSPTQDAAVEGGAAPSLAKPCPMQLPEGAADKTPLPLDGKPDLPALIQAGKEGHPRRVRLHFHHPAASSVSPAFSATDYVADAESDHPLSGMVQAIFPMPLPEAHRYRRSSGYGYTEYDVIGYFSGREIDTYEWHQLQYGKPAPPPSDEERHLWPDKHPELCVESYCATPNPNRRAYAAPTPEEEAEFRKEYQKELERMRADHVPFCVKGKGP